MKKIGKKLSYYAKVLLVLSLLFSNLMPLKTVFAYEGDNDETYVGEELDEGKELEDSSEKGEEEAGAEDENEDEKEEEASEEDEKEENNEEENDPSDEITTGDEEGTEEENEEESGEVVVDDEEENKDGEESSDEAAPSRDYTKELNDSATLLGLNATYLFVDHESERVVYVIEGVNDVEVESIVDGAFDDVSHEVVEDSIILTDGEEQISYRIVTYDEEYLNSLIETITADDATSLEDGDINGDGNVDLNDAILLKQALKNGFVNMTVTTENVVIPSKFDGDASNILVGSTFTVQYVLTLSEYAVDGLTGLLNYNKSMLRLDSFEIINFLQGNEKDGKFLYFGNDLKGTPRITTDDDGNEITVYDPADYVVIEMTFTALESGNDTLNISDLGYFYENVYYQGNESATLDVTIISGNNSLSSLTVAGTEIELSDDVTEYSITVENDVTTVDLEYVLSDLTATVSSIVAPEELAVGENTITIVVVAENGEEKTYTIVVTREEAAEEEEKEEESVSTINYSNNYANNNITEKDNKDTTKVEDKKEEDKKEEDKKEESDDNKLSRVIIIVLILAAIGGLIYLIFRDDDAEAKTANKEVNKLKKDDLDEESPKKADTSKKETDTKKPKKKER